MPMKQLKLKSNRIIFIVFKMCLMVSYAPIWLLSTWKLLARSGQFSTMFVSFFRQYILTYIMMDGTSISWYPFFIRIIFMKQKIFQFPSRWRNQRGIMGNRSQQKLPLMYALAIIFKFVSLLILKLSLFISVRNLITMSIMKKPSKNIKYIS